MRILHIIILTIVAISATYANAQMIQNGNQRVLTTQAAEIPSTDIDPADTLIPARLPHGIKPLMSDNFILRPFLGIWRGQWEGTLDTYFVITEAQGARVKVFNSWGVMPSSRPLVCDMFGEKYMTECYCCQAKKLRYP